AVKADSSGAAIGTPATLLSDAVASAYGATPAGADTNDTWFVGYYAPAVAGTYLQCDFRGAMVRGLDLSVIQEDIALGQPHTDLSYWGSRQLMTSSAARKATSEVFVQWRSVSIQWIDGEGSRIVPPAPVQGRRYKLNRPPDDPQAASLQQGNSTAGQP